MRRLLLVRHAPTAATRSRAFPSDEPLDEPGRAAAATLAASLPEGCELWSSPALRCRQTAETAGLRPRIDPVLAECDFGSWSGRSLREVHGNDPRGVREWMLDPDAAPHHGESLTEFARRVSAWLTRQLQVEGTAAAVTHGGVIKAAVVHALAEPLLECWRIEVAPLSITELHGSDGAWSVAGVNVLDVNRSPAATR